MGDTSKNWFGFQWGGTSTNELFREKSKIRGFGAKFAHVHSCKMRDKKCFASPEPTNITMRQLVNWSKLPRLISIVSKCIGAFDMYGYRENPMNTWALYINKWLFSLMEPMWLGFLICIEMTLKGDRNVCILFIYTRLCAFCIRSWYKVAPETLI